MNALADLAIILATWLPGDDTTVTPGVDILKVHTVANTKGAPEVGAHQLDTAGTKPGTATVVVPSCLEAVVPCVPVEVCEPDPNSPTGFSLMMYSGGAVQWVNGFQCEPSPAEAAQAAQPSIPALVRQAFHEVPLPEPHLSIQPPNGKTLVGLETIFSTKAEPFTRTLTLLGQQVTLKIEPSSFVWHHGDGTTQTTDWAGKAWDHDEPDIDTYLTHTFEHTGTVRPSVEVTWSAEFRVGGGAWQPVNGTVTRVGPSTPLQVLEGQPVLNTP